MRFIKLLSVLTNRQALRFGVTGLLVTAIHVSIATVCLHFLLPTSSIANGIAFVISTIISYLINTTWSFSTPIHKRNLIRFGIVSCIGLFFAMTISGAAQYYGLPHAYGIFFVICTIPLLNFLLHNYWTYR